MNAKAELLSAQEAFYNAIRQTHDTVDNLRFARKGSHARVTGKYPALTAHDSNLVRQQRPSQLRVTTGGGATGFKATMALIRRLKVLTAKEPSGPIVCLLDQISLNGQTTPTCQGLQNYWSRAGKLTPDIVYMHGTLEEAVEMDPILIVLDQQGGSAPVHGYLRVTLEDPDVCLLFRES